MMEPTTVLIVDDEPEIRTLVKEFLEGMATEFLEAANGKEAAKILLKRKAHVLITDYKMNEMDGLTLVKFLRGEKITIPTIMITGHASVAPKLRQNAILWGVLHFIEKPINQDLLRSVLPPMVTIGKRLLLVDEELEKMCKDLNIPPEQKASFKEQNRQNLITQIMMDAMSAPMTKTGT